MAESAYTEHDVPDVGSQLLCQGSMRPVNGFPWLGVSDFSMCPVWAPRRNALLIHLLISALLLVLVLFSQY